MMTPLNEIRFRSSPSLELKSLGDLAPEQREPFRDLENDPDFYGLLIPKSPHVMNLKSVARQTAKLFESLTTPSPIDDADADAVDLVLDSILEIETTEGFISGADAFPIVCSLSPDAGNPGLSRDALLHAQDLATRDPHALTTALYFYNRIPKSPFWTTRFPNPDAILAHVGADRGALRALLEREWNASYAAPTWLSWSPRTSHPGNEEGVTFKLYVSPRPERIRDAFEVVVRVLAAFPGTPFKIGNSAAGLLRPDKLIAYFTTREQLGEVARAFHRELAGCDAHGVPFTAGLDDSGLLSWGIDPPDGDRALRWMGRESWRSWLVARLGAALSVAKAARTAAAVEPWRFAIERVRREGVDTGTWTPSATLWSSS